MWNSDPSKSSTLVTDKAPSRPFDDCRRAFRKAALARALASLWLASALTGPARSAECQLVPDDRDPSQQILRCGRGLVVRSAPGTSYSPASQGEEQPNSVQLDSGALLVEFHPTHSHPTFQILTPQAIAAVRGTRWAVDVGADRTSTLVISGIVAVSRRSAPSTALLRAGQGLDVSPGMDPLVVKRWKPERVRTLLARFGE